MLAADLGAVHGPDVMQHVDEDRGGPAEVEQAGEGNHRPDEPLDLVQAHRVVTQRGVVFQNEIIAVAHARDPLAPPDGAGPHQHHHKM